MPCVLPSVTLMAACVSSALHFGEKRLMARSFMVVLYKYEDPDKIMFSFRCQDNLRQRLAGKLLSASWTL